MSNRAAWLESEKANPLVVREAPYHAPGEGQILIKSGAVAMNPVDGQVQDTAMIPRSYPTVLGEDVAGTVVEVGQGVTRFKKGDRVLGLAAGLATGKKEESAFQEFVLVYENTASLIPASMTFEQASVIPLGFATAGMGLFSEGFLELELPVSPVQSVGASVLIWGGSSSVGANAIQLANAAGYEVVTTASQHNFDMVKKIGATAVFDYKSKTVVDDIVSYLKGKQFAGAFEASGVATSIEQCVEVVMKVPGKKFMSVVNVRDVKFPFEFKSMFACRIGQTDTAKALFEGFLPAALENGSFVPAPEPQVVGKGLENVQLAIDILKQGVSAAKIVVTV